MSKRVPVWKKTEAFWSVRFVDFLKRHKQGLGTVSAVVVFMSFTLKEELGEYVKDELANVQKVIDKADKLIVDENEGIAKNGEERKLDEILARVRGEQYIAPEIPMSLVAFWHELAALRIFDSISVRKESYEEQAHAVKLES